MRVDDIKVGKTYCNRGKGKTHRKVIRISDNAECQWLSSRPAPKESVVEFIHENGQFKGQKDALYISSFAQWAGCVVEFYDESDLNYHQKG